jgi:hypothetical protein
MKLHNSGAVIVGASVLDRLSELGWRDVTLFQRAGRDVLLLTT